ncbi:MAG: ComF family protein [Desulfomonilia bacterium]|nr:ComF family protein [Deltaproteobacteria bacterium]MDX9761939.1 ComF family protein [Desulfomonilia bacterium]
MMISSLWETLLPKRCLVCSGRDRVTRGVCVRCRSLIRQLDAPLCEVCGRPVGTPGVCLKCMLSPPPFDRMVSACVYEGLIQDIIHQFKYRRATVFSKFLAGLVAQGLAADSESPDLIAAVPLHWSRLVQRGYNQSMLIARELSGYIGGVVRYDVLHKTRKTPSQVGLPKVDRERNLERAFTATGVEGKSVVVVDDVITTGRTAREVSRALRHAGAERVVFASVGRTVS